MGLETNIHCSVTQETAEFNAHVATSFLQYVRTIRGGQGQNKFISLVIGEMRSQNAIVYSMHAVYSTNTYFAEEVKPALDSTAVYPESCLKLFLQ
jgi:hypothetical protein